MEVKSTINNTFRECVYGGEIEGVTPAVCFKLPENLSYANYIGMVNDGVGVKILYLDNLNIGDELAVYGVCLWMANGNIVINAIGIGSADGYYLEEIEEFNIDTWIYAGRMFTHPLKCVYGGGLAIGVKTYIDVATVYFTLIYRKILKN